MKNKLNLFWVFLITIVLFDGCKKDEDSNSFIGKWKLDQVDGEDPDYTMYLEITDSKITVYYDEGDCYYKESSSYTLEDGEFCQGKECVDIEVKDGKLYVDTGDGVLEFVTTKVDFDDFAICTAAELTSLKKL